MNGPRTRLLVILAVIGALGAPAATAKTYKVGPGESIQTAVDLAGAGDTVKVKGMHRENVAVAVAGLTLRGEGATIDGQYLGACVSVTADDVTVEGFKLINGSSGLNGVGHRLRFLDNTIRNAKVDSILVYGDDATIESNHLFHGDGILVEADNSTSETTIAHNDLRWCGALYGETGAFVVLGNDIRNGDGIYIEADHPSATTQIAGNKLSAVTQEGIDVSCDGGGELRIESNDIDRGDDDGIRVTRKGSGAATVHKNDVDRVSGKGFYVSHEGSALLRVTKNTITNAEGNGYEINAESSGGVEVEDCSAVGCEENGVEIECTGDGDATVRDVEVRYAKEHAILVDNSAGSGDAFVYDSDIRDVVQSGIRLVGSFMTVEGCTVRHCGYEGIDVQANTTNIRDNVVRVCGNNGILIDPPNTFTGGSSKNNSVKKCGLDGIRVVDVDFYYVQFNDCRQNLGDGIDFQGGAMGWITDNSCHDNAHEGIDNSAVGTQIADNECFGNGGEIGPDIAGKGDGNGTTGINSTGNVFGTGGLTTLQRLDQ